MHTKKVINIYKPKLTKKKNVYCSPHNRNNKVSCFSKASLVKIAKEWNKNHKKKKIQITSQSTIQELWNKINQKLKKKCYGEWCWIEQDFVKHSLAEEELENTFRPKNPKDWCSKKKDWLSTTDIEEVMVQYEDLYPDFTFIGAVPIDFDEEFSMGVCVVEELCKISIAKLLNNGITKVGIVFNLDKHTESGSHWIAMFIDLKKERIYYWDSYGEKPPKEVNNLVNRIKEQGKMKGMKFRYYKNNIRHQYRNSECGVYCMYFIVKLLQGKTFREIIKNKIKDDDMNVKRGFFYTPNC